MPEDFENLAQQQNISDRFRVLRYRSIINLYGYTLLFQV